MFILICVYSEVCVVSLLVRSLKKRDYKSEWELNTDKLTVMAGFLLIYIECIMLVVSMSAHCTKLCRFTVV